jgi:type IX secretion system PorP/SprF family membrane protein
MKKILLGLMVVSGFTSVANAQDVHFTQYFTSPLTLNPAQTGLTQSDWRASANVRQQWFTVSDNPYTSGTVAFDMPVMRGKLPEGDALGIGILGLYDRSGTGGLQNTTLGLSIAYHKALGANKQHTLSLGVQGYMVQKSINFGKLIFGDQFSPNSSTGYLVNSTSAEAGNFTNNDLTYPDFNAGLMYSGRVSEKATIYGGVAMYHLTRPVERFLNSGQEVQINNRLSAHLGGSFEMNENTVLYVSGMYQKQGPASELLLGGAVGFILNPTHDEYTRNTIFYLGAWYRYGDALAPYIGFEWSKMKIGVSYDVTMSGFQNATGGNGAYEVSLIYNGFLPKGNGKRKYNFACPIKF